MENVSFSPENSSHSCSDSPEADRKRVVKRKKKSFVWNYFKEELSETEKILHCEISGCSESIIKTNLGNYSTNPMLNHLKNVHHLFPPNEQGDQKKPRVEKQISKTDQDRLDSLLYVIIIKTII